MFFQQFFDIVDNAGTVVLCFSQFFLLLVFISMCFCLFLHIFDFRFDFDRGLLTGGYILGRYIQNPVDINIEHHLNLGNTTRCRRKLFQVELTQQSVVAGHLPFSLEHADGHSGLIVSSRREHLVLGHRNRGIALNQFGHDATFCFDPE